MGERPVVVITGASSGIGEATARHLARTRDARCVLVARREDRLKTLAAEIGGDVSYLTLDVTAEDAPERVRAHVAERDGRLDVLVNNAGAAWRESFAEGGCADMRRTMELNLFAPVRLVETLLPLLREPPGGAIVNVASVAGRVARARTGAYSASKAAMIGWTDALRAEEAEHGVHVGAVLPGFVSTEGFPQSELLGRRATRWVVSTPEKVAEAIDDVAFSHRRERVVPRGYAVIGVLRTAVPAAVFRVTGGKASGALTGRTGHGE